jgi:hypothetical protein
MAIRTTPTLTLVKLKNKISTHIIKMAMNPNLSYYLERLQGYSTNTFKLESDSKTTATANDIVSFSIPSNSLVNLRSLKFRFTADAHENYSDPIGARLPPVADLVERVEVTVGGIVLSQGTNFTNVLHEAKLALGVLQDDATTGHPEFVRRHSYVDASELANTNAGLPAGTMYNEMYSTNGGKHFLGTFPYFCIDHFEGFFATADPKIFDTALVPDIKVRLHMASNTVISKASGIELLKFNTNTPVDGDFVKTSTAGANPKYVISNMYCTIECMSLADQTYDNLISSMIASQGFIEVPYKNYTSFMNFHTGSTRFTVSTQSLDRIWLTWREQDYNTNKAPVPVVGYADRFGYVGTSGNLSGTTAGVGVPLNLTHQNPFDYAKEQYQSSYFRFIAPEADTVATGNVLYQLQLNAAMMPQFMANAADMYEITRNSLQGARMSKNMSLQQYIQHYFVNCFRLNMPDSEYGRLISGLDTRAVNLQGLINTTGASATVTKQRTCNVFCESTSVLRIGAGRTIEVIA